MAQAKGVLPRRDDREVLYANPEMCGYFVGVQLDPLLDRGGIEEFTTQASGLIDQLVARVDTSRGSGVKIAAVAVGLAPTFFIVDGQPRFHPPVEPPDGFKRDLPNSTAALSAVPLLDADVMFYVASIFEARVNSFVNDLSRLPGVAGMTMDRGYQRIDDTEPFGYKDGIRNVRSEDRSRVAFVHRDGSEPYEPVWADGGSYMVLMRIRQHPDAFEALPDDTSRDQVMGRLKDGTRLDLVGQDVHPHFEPAEPPPLLPPTSHVAKVGPRGNHGVEIFRRGLPFIEVVGGEVKVGLNFCSFQASLDQFDVMFNDWAMDRHFAAHGGGLEVGVDALFDSSKALTSIEKMGFYFVPPYEAEGLSAAIFSDRKERDREAGRLVVHKKIMAPGAPERRFERKGFRFHVVDGAGHIVTNSDFVTDSTGRGLCPAELARGEAFTLVETASPVPNVALQQVPFTMDKNVVQLHMTNEVTEPTTPYGG